MIEKLLPVVAPAVIGFVALRMFFAVFRSRWPEQYWGTSALDHPLINRGFRRYLLWRFMPVLVVVTVSARALNSAHQSALWAIGPATLHWADTNGRAFFRLARGESDSRRMSILAFHLVTSVAIILTAVAALLLWHPLRNYLPTGSQLTGDLWSSLAAGFVGAYLVRTSTTRHSIKKLAKLSREEIPDHLLWLVESETAKAQVQPEIAVAILLTENLQRPKWVRRLERNKSRFIRPGSYGLMQVHSTGRISDEESIRRGVERLRASGLSRQVKDPRPAFRDFNDNDAFVDMATKIYQELLHDKSPKQ